MPEGDTVHRSAAALHRWLAGRSITAARTVRDVAIDVLVGHAVERVEALGKHLLLHTARAGPVLHTHLRMDGSWHLYRAGERWKRPSHQMRLVVEAADHVAVGFEIPVIELLAADEVADHPALAALGPDLVVTDADGIAEAVRRARRQPADRPIGDVLLDQKVAAGIGNVFRCDVLFTRGVHPLTPVGHVADDVLLSLYERSAQLLRANLDGASRNTGLGPGQAWVYGRGGKACRRCGTRIQSTPGGDHERIMWWCPKCQPGTGEPPGADDQPS